LAATSRVQKAALSERGYNGARARDFAPPGPRPSFAAADKRGSREDHARVEADRARRSLLNAPHLNGGSSKL